MLLFVNICLIYSTTRNQLFCIISGSSVLKQYLCCTTVSGYDVIKKSRSVEGLKLNLTLLSNGYKGLLLWG